MRSTRMFLSCIVLLALGSDLVAADPFASNKNTTTTRQDYGIGPRIVGGSDTAQGRFPYMVSLVDRNFKHQCGGSLIAPDIVLTAAHCRTAVLQYAQVGKFYTSGSEEDDDSETLRVIGEYPHPSYSLDAFPWDQVLLKLEGPSSKPVVSVKADHSFPTTNGEELTVLGFGTTREGTQSGAEVLQQAIVNFVPNDECSEAKDPNFGENYLGKITDDMLCADTSGKDSCQGDSGGPLIHLGDSYQDDKLIGVVSWGVGCARSGFPGVYSRTSADYTWLRHMVCVLSNENAPDSFECDSGDTFSPAPTPPSALPASPSDPTSDLVAVLVLLILDNFPSEVSWRITDGDNKIVHEVEAGAYRTEDEVQAIVYLQVGREYTFSIRDGFGDGLNGEGTGYTIFNGSSLNDGQVLVTGDGKYFDGEDKAFRVPEFIGNVEVSEGKILLTVQIMLDDFPQDSGFTVEKLLLSAEEVASIQAGIFLVPYQTVVRTYFLDEGELHNFHVVDAFGDGIKQGFVRLFLGTVDTTDEQSMILDIDGSFGIGFDFTFTATRTTSETESPEIISDNFLTLELYMDLFPEEISIVLSLQGTSSDLEDHVLFFRPPRHYAERASQTVTEIIPIPDIPTGSRQGLVFVINDAHGDGLCCDWNGGTALTGYKLFEGDTERGAEIISSTFARRSREATPFTLPLDANPVAPSQSPPSAAPVSLIALTLMIGLDLFPEETGVIIRKVDTKQVVFIRHPGDFADRREEMVYEEISVVPGLYEFEILDHWSDGIATFQDDSYYGFYLLALSSEVEKNQYTPILFGYGDSFEDRSKTEFIVEGGEILVADSPFGWYNDESSKEMASVNVVEGGLYKLQLFDSGDDGGIEAALLLGSIDPDQARIVSLNSFNSLEEIKVIAATEQRNAVSSDRRLSLRMLLENTPQAISWIIIRAGSGSSLENESTFEIQRMATSRTTVAFGPPLPYGEHLAGTEFIETIAIPQVWGTQSFSLLISDSEGDGGTVGVIELFDGSVEDGILLFSTSLDNTPHLVESFQLEDTPQMCAFRVRTSLCSQFHTEAKVEGCDCYNFCNGVLSGCCAFGEPCDIQCDQQDIAVAGCIFDEIDGVVDVDEIAPSIAPRSEAASSCSRKTSSTRLILSALLLLLFAI